MDDIPSHVKSFVRRHIPSMDHLDVLIRLHDNPDAAFTTAELEAATHVRGTMLSRVIDDLRGAGFARVVDREGTVSVLYGARGSAAQSDVDDLALMYHQRPVSLVRLVYEQPSTPLRSFADAFRLRKDDDT